MAGTCNRREEIAAQFRVCVRVRSVRRPGTKWLDVGTTTTKWKRPELQEEGPPSLGSKSRYLTS